MVGDGKEGGVGCVKAGTFLSRIASDGIDNGRMGNAEEPGTEAFGVSDLADGSPSEEEGFLDEVFCAVDVGNFEVDA